MDESNHEANVPIISRNQLVLPHDHINDIMNVAEPFKIQWIKDEDSQELIRSFEVDLIVWRNQTVMQTIISISKTDHSIEIWTKHNLLLFSIHQADYVSFVCGDDIPGKAYDYITTRLKLGKEELQNKTLCRIMYVPNVIKSNCCYCCCAEEYTERQVTTVYFFINYNIIHELRNTLSKNSYPKWNELEANNRKRRILIFVNPISGKGLSLKLWNKAKKVLDLANWDLTVILTQKVKHAYDVVKSLKIDEYDGIVNCSGDGILHEIVNGIFQNPEREAFLNRVVVAALPAGSSNGFSKAITDYCGDDNRIETTAYYIGKGISKKVDLQEVELRDIPEKIYSFLSVTWSIIADIDIESEVIRCCGIFRNTIWGVFRLACFRKYYGALYTLPQDREIEISQLPKLSDPLDESIYVKQNDQWNFFISGNTKYIAESMKPWPWANIQDGFNDIVALRAGTSGKWWLFQEWWTYIDNGDEFIDKDGHIRDGIEYHKTKFWRWIPKTRLDDPDDVNVKHNFIRFFSIDGERYPICPIQCITLPKILSVYSGKE